jgi:prophage antirepressor-like protein
VICRNGDPWDGDGDPWWILAEVCRVVDLTNPSAVAARLGEDEKATLSQIEGGNPGTRYTIINEAGPYEGLRKSDKPVLGPRRS